MIHVHKVNISFDPQIWSSGVSFLCCQDMKGDNEGRVEKD